MLCCHEIEQALSGELWNYVKLTFKHKENNLPAVTAEESHE